MEGGGSSRSSGQKPVCFQTHWGMSDLAKNGPAGFSGKVGRNRTPLLPCGLFPQSRHSPPPAGCPAVQLSSDATWHSVRFHGRRAQSHKIAPTSHARGKSGCHRGFCRTGYKSEAPMSSLASMNLLEWLTEFRLPVSLLDQRFIIQGYNSEKTDVGDTGQGVWGGARSCHVLSGRPATSQHLHVFSPEALQTPSFWGFIEVSLHRGG